MKHKHHIIPKHAGGTNAPENLIELTVPEHAEAHRLLWEQHGKLQDKLAWLMLSGKTEEAEVCRIELCRTPEARAKLSASLKGHIKSPEHCANLSKALTGKQHSFDTRQKQRTQKIGKTDSWNHQTKEQHAAWAEAIAEGRRQRWERTSFEDRQAASKRMNDIQRETGSWKKGQRVAAEKRLGTKDDPTLVAKRNASQKAFYQTDEGKRVLVERGRKIAEAHARRRQTKAS
jgi:hypothetical protein